MHDRRVVSLLLATAMLLLPVAGHPQSFNGSVSGTVLDPSGAAVPGAALLLRNSATGVELKRTSGAGGAHAFRNLLPGTYEMSASFAGFQPFLRRGVVVSVNGDVRLDVSLALGGQTAQVEVVGASAMVYESGAHEDGISPATLQDLPLAMGSGPRSSAAFAILMPGVSTGGRAPFAGSRLARRPGAQPLRP